MIKKLPFLFQRDYKNQKKKVKKKIDPKAIFTGDEKYHTCLAISHLHQIWLYD